MQWFVTVNFPNIGCLDTSHANMKKYKFAAWLTNQAATSQDIGLPLIRGRADGADFSLEVECKTSAATHVIEDKCSLLFNDGVDKADFSVSVTTTY